MAGILLECTTSTKFHAGARSEHLQAITLFVMLAAGPLSDRSSLVHTASEACVAAFPPSESCKFKPSTSSAALALELPSGSWLSCTVQEIADLVARWQLKWQHVEGLHDMLASMAFWMQLACLYAAHVTALFQAASNPLA